MSERTLARIAEAAFGGFPGRESVGWQAVAHAIVNHCAEHLEALAEKAEAAGREDHDFHSAAFALYGLIEGKSGEVASKSTGPAQKARSI